MENEGREIVAETLGRETPKRSAKSCCVMPFCVSISFMYAFIFFLL
nr:MAG TPA: GTPase [Caudoviricetes sp.]